MGDTSLLSKFCMGMSLIQNNRSKAYRNYLKEMTDDYIDNFMDYLLNSSEEDVENSEYLMNDGEIVGIGFYRNESPNMTTVHKVLYFKDPTYECMHHFFENITDGKVKPHNIVWKFEGEECLTSIGIDLCFKHNGYMESFSNKSSVYFSLGGADFD